MIFLESTKNTLRSEVIMKGNGLVLTQVTYDTVMLLKKIREEVEEAEKKKPRKRIRITKREVCEELVKRCLEKKVI